MKTIDGKNKNKKTTTRFSSSSSDDHHCVYASLYVFEYIYIDFFFINEIK